MNYGITYMGSKSSIVHKICAVFPEAENFYDLFGGGFSITHFMIKNRKNDFKQFHFNEIRPGICKMIQGAIEGKYSYEKFKPDFITREKFLSDKEKNAYIKIVWSFGNNGKSYLFGKDIEGQKESLHNAVVFNKFDNFAKDVLKMDKFNEGYSIKDRRLFLKTRITKAGQQLERLEFYSTSYEKVKIKKNSVIYCDIPYQGAADYGEFDHDKFFNWASEVDQPLYISEYNIDDPRFFLIWSTDKRSLLSAKKDKLIKSEKVYSNKAGYHAYVKRFNNGVK